MDEGITLGRAIGGIDLAVSLMNRADITLTEADYGRTMDLASEAIDLFRELRNAEGLATALFNWASAALGQGRHSEALPFLLESLDLFESIGFEPAIAVCLDHLAAALADTGAPVVAVQLLGAAERLCDAVSAVRAPHELRLRQETVTDVRGRLGTLAFDSEYAAGRALSRDAALARARAAAPEVTSQRSGV